LRSLAVLFRESLLRLLGVETPKISSISNFAIIFPEKDIGRLVSLALDNYHVEAGELDKCSEITPSNGTCQAIGQWTPRHNDPAAEPHRCGPGQHAREEYEFVFRPKRVHPFGHFLEQKRNTEATATDELPPQLFRNRLADDRPR
jgi:hypothetical protein